MAKEIPKIDLPESSTALVGDAVVSTKSKFSPPAVNESLPAASLRLRGLRP